MRIPSEVFVAFVRAADALERIADALERIAPALEDLAGEASCAPHARGCSCERCR